MDQFHRFVLSVCMFSAMAYVSGSADEPLYTPLGAVHSLTGALPSTRGEILSVSIGRSGVGLIGGAYYYEDEAFSRCYAALVSPTEALHPLIRDLPSTNGNINGVSINDSGVGLIGGQYKNGVHYPCYAALVSPTGVLHSLRDALPSSDAAIMSVSIDDSGAGLIGGWYNHDTRNCCYAALVSPTGTLYPLIGDLPSDNDGSIASVSINDSGAGLIGGYYNDGTIERCYAALVSPTGTLHSLRDFPLTEGNIVSVSIDDSGAGLIGGWYKDDEAVTHCYAALVSPTGVLHSLTRELPSNTGNITSVSIDDSGAGLIGGQYHNGVNDCCYAALVSPNGTLHSLVRDLPSTYTGNIESVSINDSGAGFIGGSYQVPEVADRCYVAFVSANGALLSLTDAVPSTEGNIDSVSINDSGEGLIGGWYNDGVVDRCYAALVLEDTPSSVTAPAFIFLQNDVVYSVWTAMKGLKSRVISLTTSQLSSVPATDLSQFAFSDSAVSLLADAQDMPLDKIQNSVMQGCSDQPKYAFWIEPFGSYLNFKKERKIPRYTNEIGGMLAAFDYHTQQLLLGGGLGYAFNYVNYRQSQGQIHEELAYLYGSFKTGCAWLDTSLWVGPYQFYNKRHASFTTAKAHAHGWILSPHFEGRFPCAIHDCIIEPFMGFDGTNSWQSRYTERGKSQPNIVMKSQYAFLLQSEVGLRFFETLHLGWGRCLFEEKVSYVNQAPFHFKNQHAQFVTAGTTFPIATGSSKVQNLGSVEFLFSLLPKAGSYPFVIIDLETEGGSALQSYFASLQIGKAF